MNICILSALLLSVPLCAWPESILDRPNQRLPDLLSSSAVSVPDGVIRRIEFAGLRRIAGATLRAHVGSREGQPLDPAQLEADVRALDRLGWFESVTAEVHPMLILLAAGIPSTGEGAATRLPTGSLALVLSPGALQEMGLRLVFVLEERPFLAGVEFRGSRLLLRKRIEALLAEKQIVLKVAAPTRPTDLWRAACAIEAALAEMGHPRAEVRLHLKEVPTAAVRTTFEISDGPSISVGRVTFTGNQAFSERKLKRQMKRVAPDATFAELRGKNIYTDARLAEDLRRIANFYRNHGYPEARLGEPTATVAEERVRRWFPWPRVRTQPRFHLSIPVEEGRFYRLGAVEVHSELAAQNSGERPDALAALRSLNPTELYSQEKLEKARLALERSRAFRRAKSSSPPEVEVSLQFDPQAGVARVSFRVREAHPYMVRRLEFVGQRRFSDLYYRRRILLKEGEPFDSAKLELGLAQLARTGFIRQVKRQDVRVELEDEWRTADVTIRVEEIGRQKVSLVGGRGAFGSTIGVVYNVFDLFRAEELITGHLEGGPETLQVMLSLAKEGLLGTRGSFGLSLFQNVVRPNLPSAFGQGRLFTSSSTGLGVSWVYPMTPRDTLGVNYLLSHSSTRYHVDLPSNLSGVAGNQLRASTASRSVGLTMSRDAGSERLDSRASVSGGWLGGDENLLRSSVEYARLLPDPLGLNQGRNTWAFRSYVAGVSSYCGELPLHARLFSSDDLVRGFRAGELAPYALARSDRGDGTSSFRAQSPGANLIGAVNMEYRVPVARRTETAAFFDLGSGWLLPGWLGPSRPMLLEGTNGALRSSAGIEMRWLVPGVNQTLRVHYALSPLRLRRALLLPDGTRFRPPERRTALGWALGSLF